MLQGARAPRGDGARPAPPLEHDMLIPDAEGSQKNVFMTYKSIFISNLWSRVFFTSYMVDGLVYGLIATGLYFLQIFMAVCFYAKVGSEPSMQLSWV